jgi:dihydroxyacetone kinase-like protein
VDVYDPTLSAFAAAATAGATLAVASAAAEVAANEGMRTTTAVQACKGHASYLGPRSVGHQDPGAA